MNERIRELAEQAGVFAGDFAGAGLYSIHNKDEVEKFAELIVRECMLVGFNAVYEVADDSKAFAVYQNIKKNFGVE